MIATSHAAETFAATAIVWQREHTARSAHFWPGGMGLSLQRGPALLVSLSDTATAGYTDTVSIGVTQGTIYEG